MSFLACCPYSAPMLLTQSKNRGLHSWWWFGRIWQHNNHKNSLLILEQKFDQCLSLFFQYNMHVWNKHFLPSNSTNAAWKEPNTKCRIWPWNNMHIYYIGCTHDEWKNHCPPKKRFSIICFKGRTIGSQLQLPVTHSCPFLHRHGLYAMSFLFIFLQLLFLCIYYIDGHILLFHFALLWCRANKNASTVRRHCVTDSTTVHTKRNVRVFKSYSVAKESKRGSKGYRKVSNESTNF